MARRAVDGLWHKLEDEVEEDFVLLLGEKEVDVCGVRGCSADFEDDPRICLLLTLSPFE